MKNIIKYPLVLGTISVVCALALGIVYDITNPVIVARENAAAVAAMSEIVPESTNAEVITSDFDNTSSYGITAIYKAYHDTDVIAYGLQAEGSGMKTGIVILFVVSAVNDEFIGVKPISNSETSGYGADYLAATDFATSFVGLKFDNLETGMDKQSGVTVTYNGVLNMANSVIDFYLENIKA